MTIEGNKDEAFKCIEIAQGAISSGNYAKAERFLMKAERLYPTSVAQDLLTLVRASRGTTPPTSPTKEDVRKRKPATTQSQSAAGGGKEFTTEQMNAVRRIKTKCKDYYEILGLFKLSFYIVLNCLINCVVNYKMQKIMGIRLKRNQNSLVKLTA